MGTDLIFGKMIAEALGVMPEWKEIRGGPNSRLKPLLKKGLILLSTFHNKGKNGGNKSSEPYFTTGLGLIIRADKKDIIKTYSDLDGRPVAVIKGTTGEKLRELI